MTKEALLEATEEFENVTGKRVINARFSVPWKEIILTTADQRDHVYCDSCHGLRYLEVTTEDGEENQWCQECCVTIPDEPCPQN